MKLKIPKQRILWGMNPTSRVISNEKKYNRQESIKKSIREAI